MSYRNSADSTANAHVENASSRGDAVSNYAARQMDSPEANKIFAPSKSEWNGSADSQVHSVNSQFGNFEDAPTAMHVPNAWEGGGWDGPSPLSAQSIIQRSDCGQSASNNTDGVSVSGTGDFSVANGPNGDVSITANGNSDISITFGNNPSTSSDSGSSTTSDSGSATPTSDSVIAALQQSDPTLAQVLSDSQSQMSSSGFGQYEQNVSQDLSSGAFPDDGSLLQAAAFQLQQQGGSSADVSAAESVAQNDLASNGDNAVSTYGTNLGANSPGWQSETSGDGGAAGGEAGSGSSDSSWDDSASSESGTGNSANSASSDANTAMTPSQIMQVLEQTDPALAQVLLDSQSQMSPAAFSQYLQDVYQNWNSGAFPDDASLLEASAYQLQQQGGSAADVSAAQSVAQSDISSLGDSQVSTYGSSGQAVMNSLAGESSAGAGTDSAASGSATGTDNGGSSGADSGGTAPATNAGSSDTGTANGAATGTGTSSSSSGLSNAEAATVQVTANDGNGEESLGSGFFASSNGLIVTDDHVVQGSQGPIQITTANGQTLDATTVATDPANDLAILQVTNAGSNPDFSYIPVNADSAPTSTDYAIGHPDGVSNLEVTPGDYSGEAAYGSLGVADQTVADNPNRDLLSFTNMDTQPGSSGSPVINNLGQLVGVNDVGDGQGNADSTLVAAVASDLSALGANG